MFKDFFNFDKMITPSIIQIIFWIGVVFSVLAGLVMIVNGITAQYGGGMLVLMGLIYLVLGPLFTRVFCELVIVFFKINDNLIELKKRK